jgi:dTDP-4-dehydrorhamnose reductase
MLGRAVVAVGRARGVAVLGLPRAQADLERPETLHYWMETFRPEVVFNCAAFTRVDDCEVERERARSVNGAGVAHLVAACETVSARLFQVSTDYVFDGRGARPYRVDDPTAPRSVYGASKRLGEESALGYAKAAVVRTSWLFGPGGPNFVRAIACQVEKRVATGDATPLRVVADQTGCPTYTPFLARGLWDLSARKVSGVFHYCNREATSWHGLASEIVASLRPELRVEPVSTAEFPRPAARPAYSVLDVSRFQETVGRIVEPWRRGLDEYLEHLSSETQGRKHS